MSKKQKTLEEKLASYAKQTWEVMQREAKHRGFALTKHSDYGDGRVIINTVGAFISGLSKERGWNVDENQRDLIRRYLKSTGNVVVLEKVEQYRYRIFVREEWSDSPILPVPVKSGTSKTEQYKRSEDKVTPEEAGEDREPAPVKFKCVSCDKEWDNQRALNAHMAVHKPEERPAPKRERKKPHPGTSQPLGEQQVAILKAMVALGGTAAHPHGRASHVVWEQDKDGISKESVGSSVTSMAKRGLLLREGNKRRAFRIVLTREGWKAAEELLGIVAQPPQPPWSGQPKTDISPTTQTRELLDGVVNDVTQELLGMSDEALLDVLKLRLLQPKQDPKAAAELDELKQKVALIGTLVEDVMEGKTTPLRALGEIQEAVKL